MAFVIVVVFQVVSNVDVCIFFFLVLFLFLFLTLFLFYFFSDAIGESASKSRGLTPHELPRRPHEARIYVD